MLSSLCCLVYPTTPCSALCLQPKGGESLAIFSFWGFHKDLWHPCLILWGFATILVRLRRWGGILFHGDAGFLGTLMDSPLYGDGSVLGQSSSGVWVCP